VEADEALLFDTDSPVRTMPDVFRPPDHGVNEPFKFRIRSGCTPPFINAGFFMSGYNSKIKNNNHDYIT
jgi:hypothetical protein